MGFKQGDKVEFTAGNGRVYQGTFIRYFHPAPKAGKHWRVELTGTAGMVATVFANGKVGKSLRKVDA